MRTCAVKVGFTLRLRVGVMVMTRCCLRTTRDEWAFVRADSRAQPAQLLGAVVVAARSVKVKVSNRQPALRSKGSLFERPAF